VEVRSMITGEGKERYILLDQGELVLPAVKFLKYKDNSGSAKNTLRRYCFDLKLLFEFLKQKNNQYFDIGIDEVAEFVRWLQNPHQDIKVVGFDSKTMTGKREPRTINAILNTVMNFFEYIMRHEDYSLELSEKFKKQISGTRSSYKGFLFHISKTKNKEIRTLKLKVPKKKMKCITKEQFDIIFESCSNIRDKFLIYLLYETGIRIGEALSLHLSDIVPGANKIHIKDRGELENGAEIKTVCSERTIDCSQTLINLYSDYILQCHTEEVDTNFVFIKLSGENTHMPMTYTTVDGVFKSLKNKTGIHITPHMFRHSSLTELWRSGMRPETLKIRAGHKQVQTTMQMYVSVSDEDVRKDWEKSVAKKEVEL
jgi:integrase/recombinase XerD